MKNNTSRSQKIGWVVFTIGGLSMLGLGWLYSWWVVPAANQIGGDAYSGLFGFFWELSIPVGAFIVAIGAALIANVERRVLWFLTLLLVLVALWNIFGSINQLVPAFFGFGGGLITLFFLGSTWQWAKTRPSLTASAKTGSDLRMVGFIFFVLAAWDLCGIFGMARYVLRPELAEKFSVPLSSTIDSASYAMVLLVLGWGFNFFGQLVSRQARAEHAGVETTSQIAAAD